MRIGKQLACLTFAAFAVFSAGGCGGEGTRTIDINLGFEGEPNMGTLKISTDAFTPGGPIPKRYTGEGPDVSPAVRFEGVPEGAASLALICDDPDAPRPEPFVHWVVYAIPADAAGIPEGAPRDPELADPAGARQGINSFSGDNVGYRGPMPPEGHGVHHYHFKLYALDAVIDLPAGTADKAALLAAMQGHVLDVAELIGTYER